MFGIMSRSFFLQTLAFPSLWSIKPCPRIFEARLLFFLLMSGFASSGVASVLLFMKSSVNSRL